MILVLFVVFYSNLKMFFNFVLYFRKHYKEYLVDRINKAKLDPLPMYDKIELLLTREEKAVPEKEVDESDEDYRERLIEVEGRGRGRGVGRGGRAV